MKNLVIIEAARSAYSMGDVADNTMTVGDLIAYLSNFDEDSPVILSHDNGYTYGGIQERDITEDSIMDEDDEEIMNDLINQED